MVDIKEPPLLRGGSLVDIAFFCSRIRNRKSQPALTIRPLPDNPYSTLIDFTRGYDGTWAPFKVSKINSGVIGRLANSHRAVIGQSSASHQSVI